MLFSDFAVAGLRTPSRRSSLDFLQGASMSQSALASPVDTSFPIERVLITARLGSREPRAPDYEGESRALNALAAELALPQGDILKALTDTALTLCRAHTAGISILEMDDAGGAPLFRWHSVSGKWAAHKGGSMPRAASPCGTILDRNHYELMASPERHYAAMRGVEPPIHEVLLMPFSLLGAPVGTIWVIAHDATVRFDGEDLRLMGNLASFAATAYVIQSTLKVSIEQREELSRTNTRLMRYQVGARGEASGTATGLGRA
jgi:hypothetical protein